MASGEGHHPFVGVDSSVSALLLRQQGYDIKGLFMKNWEEDDTETYCAAAQDVADARSVCEAIGIDRVFTRFLKEYEAERTPNPERQLWSAAALPQLLFFRISHSNIWLTPGPDCRKGESCVEPQHSKGFANSAGGFSGQASSISQIRPF